MEPETLIPVSFSENGTDMPLNENDRAWIRQEIQAAHKRAGWSKLTGFLKDWSGVGAALTVVVLLFTQWTAYTEFRVHTNDRLEDIENALRTLQASSSPKRVLSELATLPPKDLGKSLSALRIVAQQPVAEVKPAPATLQDVQRNLLRVDENAPDYWPTVLQFIGFASTAIAPNAPPHGTPPNITLKNVVASGQVINRRAGVILLDGGILQNMAIEDSRIIFTNNPVILKNVSFINCAFEFPSESDQPPDFIKLAGRILLASNLQNTYISGI
jgi:hypothetical protein